MRAILDRGAKLLEQIPKPDHPENYFVFDHTKWIFYAAGCYTWLGDDQPAEEHAREVIAYHTQPDGSSDAPMRSANAHVDLAVIRTKHGDVDQAVYTDSPPSDMTARPRRHCYPMGLTLTASSPNATPRAADRRLPRSVHGGAGKPAATGALVRIERKPHGDALDE